MYFDYEKYGIAKKTSELPILSFFNHLQTSDVDGDDDARGRVLST